MTCLQAFSNHSQCSERRFMRPTNPFGPRPFWFTHAQYCAASLVHRYRLSSYIRGDHGFHPAPTCPSWQSRPSLHSQLPWSQSTDVIKLRILWLHRHRTRRLWCDVPLSPRVEQLLSSEKCVDVDEAHATRDRARQSWTNDGGVVSVPRYKWLLKIKHRC